MLKIMLLIAFFLLFFSPFFRCLLSNLHNVGIYSIRDIYEYFKYQKWKDFNYFGIDMFVGMFGHGKTLSMSHTALNIYARFGDNVRFISNYELKTIPYIPLINFNQLVDLGEEQDNKYVGTVVLIDEIENVLNNRNYANFPLELLHLLTQQRKKRVYILCSAQRYFQVDKLWRTLTTNVYDCNKFWRFCHLSRYDAWDYEQAMNPQLLKRNGNFWWFVRNRDYNAYDTSCMVSKDMAENFISNEESLVRRGLDSMSNVDAIKKPSRKLKVKKTGKR